MPFNNVLLLFSFAKDIRVHNLTDKRLYVSVYERPFLGDTVVRCSDVIAIDPLAFSLLGRPAYQLGVTCHIAATQQPNDLLSSIDKTTLKRLCSIGMVGATGARVFDNFYVVQKNKKLLMHDPVSLKVSDFKDTLIKNMESSFDAYRFSLASHSLLVAENKHKDKEAYVRVGKQLCDQEKAYLNKRMPKVKKALELFLQQELNGSYVPKIAFINSGGGIRSLIACMGFHIGAQEIGLLDTITYNVGLSGGAWFIALWMHSQLTLNAFKKMMRQLVQKDLLIGNTADAKLFVDALLVRFGLKQPVTMVNSWGALLANRYLSFLGNKRHHALWSDTALFVEDGSQPLPILSATSGSVAESFENRPKVPWFEYTPFEVGCVGDFLGDVFVPTWAFGRKFERGRSVDCSPPLDLGGILGICGSGFALSFARVYEKVIKEMPILSALGDFLISKVDKETFGNKRFSVGKVRNFAKGMPCKVSQDKNIKMVDGGIAFDLPYPPVSGHGARKADVMIFFDSSSNVENKGPENLRMIAAYAKKHGLKFPPIDTKLLHKSALTLFKDESDSTVPLVIYMSRTVVDDIEYPDEVPGSFSTNFSMAKFAYKEADFDALSAVTHANIVGSKDIIKRALSEHIQRNNGF